MNLRSFLLITLTVLISCFSGYSQQEPQFSQYMFYGIAMNPAVAGSENAICVTGADRLQWYGFEDMDGNKVAPETFFISIMSPIKFLKGGVSAVIMQDKIGFEKNVALKIGYAYQRNVGFGKMGIGTHLEFNNKSYDFSKFVYIDPTDPILSQLTANESDMLIDFSLGAYYNVPGSYHIGLSGLHLIQTKGKELSTTGSSGLRMKLDRTFILEGGYQYVFPRNPDFEFDPSALLRTNLSTFQFDITGILKYKEIVWGGVGYRLQDAVVFLVGLQFRDFKFGYSYDINVSKLKMPLGGGSHEVMLNYCFKLETDKGRKSYKNTRFL
jgi:type IX secretion system PorP/SprF family membrane protein